MTKKEFYSLIDKFIQAGYNENSVIKLRWTTKPSSKWERCGIPARIADEIEIKWDRFKWYSNEESGYTTEIVFKDSGTWYVDDPRRYQVSGSLLKGLPPVEREPYNYTTAEEVLEGFEEDYGQAYRYWEVSE